MSENEIPFAFVLMKFDGEPEKDRRYQAIREVCLEAGILPKRADEISTSGPVVDEVMGFLRTADLVIADSSGDSQSVSYEIGFCHGIGRSSEATLLLRKDTNIPFNYQHFRHEIYKSTAGLKKILRKKLNLPPAFTNHDYGYVVTLTAPQRQVGFDAVIYRCLMQAIKHFKFSGRFEVHINDSFLGFEIASAEEPHPIFGEHYLHVHAKQTPADASDQRYIRVGLAAKQLGGGTPEYMWWRDFSEYLAHLITESDHRLEHADTMSELGQVFSIRSDMEFSGAMVVKNGQPIAPLFPFAFDPNGQFAIALRQA